MTVSPKVRSQVFERDCKCCVACGTSYGLTIQHRINRGYGRVENLGRVREFADSLLCLQYRP